MKQSPQDVPASLVCHHCQSEIARCPSARARCRADTGSSCHFAWPVDAGRGYFADHMSRLLAGDGEAFDATQVRR